MWGVYNSAHKTVEFNHFVFDDTKYIFRRTERSVSLGTKQVISSIYKKDVIITTMSISTTATTNSTITTTSSPLTSPINTVWPPLSLPSPPPSSHPHSVIIILDNSILNSKKTSNRGCESTIDQVENSHKLGKTIQIFKLNSKII